MNKIDSTELIYKFNNFISKAIEGSNNKELKEAIEVLENEVLNLIVKVKESINEKE